MKISNLKINWLRVKSLVLAGGLVLGLSGCNKETQKNEANSENTKIVDEVKTNSEIRENIDEVVSKIKDYYGFTDEEGIADAVKFCMVEDYPELSNPETAAVVSRNAATFGVKVLQLNDNIACDHNGQIAWNYGEVSGFRSSSYLFANGVSKDGKLSLSKDGELVRKFEEEVIKAIAEGNLDETLSGLLYEMTTNPNSSYYGMSNAAKYMTLNNIVPLVWAYDRNVLSNSTNNTIQDYTLCDPSVPFSQEKYDSALAPASFKNVVNALTGVANCQDSYDYESNTYVKTR